MQAILSNRFRTLSASDSVRLQHIALPILFALFGMLMGTWAGRIPALRDGLQISHSALSTVLVCGGLGAVVSYPLSSRSMAKFGGRKTVLYAGLGLLAVLPCIGAAHSVPMLRLAVLMLGVAASCFDVGINSVATKFEKTIGRSRMSVLHGWGCAGSLAGALFGSFFASQHIKPSAHFIAVAVPASFILLLGYRFLDAGDGGEKVEKRTFSLPKGSLALLGMLGFFGAMSEGSIADWSGVFLKDHFGVTDGFAPLALSGFTVMMLLCRLAGDKLKTRHGARKLVARGATASAAGLFFAVFAPNACLAVAGFALAGFGLALVFPFVFSAAGKEGPVALAGVATMGYSGSLMGPPVVGALAHAWGMQVAIGFLGLLSLAIAAVAARTPKLQ
jgi:fucose permease